ncbi:MAG TPA: class I SAM-dependent methyltransferase [Nocardioides sp.]|uniref:class I SAM-dependent methyltransferase n=1 Tax=Nocardioides sp. TaxID=35761 RepID=UPI002BBEC7F5|nr:class I SAM-dependent methyltransferase [Nocardioides sp.]HTW17238.1 class I SAM-dependent methyltransferase [Nocardioides sp.]
MSEEQMFTQQFWDERYAGSDRIWSGNPNRRLVDQVEGMKPGTALDVGCGEGADVVWLARHGWRATGVDVSQVALDRAAEHAESNGVAAYCSWQRVDLLAGDPLPSADLVSVHFLHLPDPQFATAYAATAAAVLPGGTLLVVAHHPADVGTGMRNERLAHLLFGPEKVTALLDPAEWDVQVADAPTREETRDGRTATVTDTVVRAVRRA